MSFRSPPVLGDASSGRYRRPHRGLIIALVLTGGAAAGAYLACRSLIAGIERYGDLSPDPMPEVILSPANRKNLFGRMTAFRTAIEAHRATTPLTLTADELNGLLDAAPGVGGKFRVEIRGDVVRARFCLPLEDLGFPQLHGRFLNGTAVLKLSIVEGELVVSPEAIQVKAGQLPESVMARLRKANLARLAFRDARIAKSLRKLGRVEVRDGIVEIKAR